MLTKPFHLLLRGLQPARRELLLKEMRLLGRDAALWSQFVLLIPLVLVYVVGVSVLPLVVVRCRSWSRASCRW
ncbi:MAG: hypothetical protein U5K74_14305 [Gemmatimonadaceae bacterium]|nr:hypothetical protein [Gemmatimonadaceae bacterium]